VATVVGRDVGGTATALLESIRRRGSDGCLCLCFRCSVHFDQNPKKLNDSAEIRHGQSIAGKPFVPFPFPIFTFLTMGGRLGFGDLF